MSPADAWLSLARHSPLVILTDLDGTLIPFAARPDLARPGPEVVRRLADLAAQPGLSVAVVSGRPRESMERFFGEVPALWLVAEHGAWRRGEGAWQPVIPEDPGPVEGLAEMMRRFAEKHPKVLVEKKTWSAAFHYRGVPARERMDLLVEVNTAIEGWLAKNPGYERLEGAMVLEVRPARARKSLVVSWARERAGEGARLLALGDDLTDEDMFRSLGAADESICVGMELGRATAARWRLESPDAANALLGWIQNARKDAPTEPLPVTPQPVESRHAGGKPGSKTAYRLLTISNRLPELRTPTGPGQSRKKNVGGLVSALEPVLSSRRGLWLGWSGRTLPVGGIVTIGMDDSNRPALAWIDLPVEWYDKYYNGFCNRNLWPLFHTFPSRVRFSDSEWECYVKVNEAFADAAASLVEPDVPIWVHDYHLLLLAGALRRRGHRGPIGLFLHIPFPGVDLFSMIPWGDRLLDEMLAFDLLGFHTPQYVENFRQAVGALTPAVVGDDVIEHRGRRIRVRAFPIGIIPEGFQEPPEAGAPDDAAALLQAISGSKLVIGVDRLDYTKGIPERLLAVERLLQMFPEWRGKISMVQISVPSRADVPDYAEERQKIENAVGRINGEFGEAHWMPVRYLYRSYGRNQLSQLYRAADVGLVTPLRDGMNLVAKEYVAAQDPANPGVLLLSKFAGAATELTDALITNPYHVDGMARDLDLALRMSPEERRDRHQKLLAAVSRTTAATWGEEFVAALEACRTV